MYKYKLIRSLIGIGFVLILPLFLLFKVEAIDYGSLGGRPAIPSPDAPNDTWFVYNLEGGEALEDSILVVNNYEEQLNVLVYAADGLKSSSGGFALKQLSEEKTAIGSWIKFYPNPIPKNFKQLFEENDESILKFCSLKIEKDLDLFNEWCDGVELVELVLSGQDKIEVKFTFSVPENADIGEHTGGILIQKTQPDTENSLEGSGIILTTRVGVRVYQTVPGDIFKKLAITDFFVVKNYNEFDFKNPFSKDKIPETITISTELANSGNVSVGFTEVLSITDEWFGDKTEDIPERSFPVLREDSFNSSHYWENPRFGKFSFVNNIEFVDEEGVTHNLTTDSITILIIPWREIVVALVVIMLLFVPSIISRIRYSGKHWDEYIVKSGDSLETIVGRMNISWKVFVKTNRLKPPYILKAGQKIRVPSRKS